MPDPSFAGPQTEASVDPADLESVEQPPDPDDRQAFDEPDDTNRTSGNTRRLACAARVTRRSAAVHDDSRY
ncbi:MAG: hypothetical protein ACRDR6_18550 [Pseudonocardiaceae bacterium]